MNDHQAMKILSSGNYLSHISIVFIIILVRIATGCDAPGLTESLSFPEVNNTTPADNARDVAINTAISATFNKAMEPATINEATFIVNEDTTVIAGSIFYNDSTVTFLPARSFGENTRIRVIITSEVTDVHGFSLGENYEWSFNTSAPEYEGPPPVILSTNPSDGASDIEVNTAVIATFDQSMDPATVNTATFFLKQENTVFSGMVDYADSTAVFTPVSELEKGKTYTATVTGGAKNLAGNSLSADYNWSFTTEQEIDRTPPRVITTVPEEDESEVSRNIRLTVTFSEPIDPSTITEETFILERQRRGRDAQISGKVSYSDDTATFIPDRKLREEADYIATITTGVTDLSGNTLQEKFQWRFETEDD